MRTWGWATLEHWSAADRRFFLENRLCKCCQDKRIKSVEAACSRCSVTKRRGRPPGVKESRPREKRAGNQAVASLQAPKKLTQVKGTGIASSPSTRAASSVVLKSTEGPAAAKRARGGSTSGRTSMTSTDFLPTPFKPGAGERDRVVKLERHLLHTVRSTSLLPVSIQNGSSHEWHSSSSQPTGMEQQNMLSYPLQSSWNTGHRSEVSLAPDHFSRMPTCVSSSHHHDRCVPLQHQDVGPSHSTPYGICDNYGMYAPDGTFYNQPSASVVRTEPEAGAARGPLLKMMHCNAAGYMPAYQVNEYTAQPSACWPGKAEDVTVSMQMTDVTASMPMTDSMTMTGPMPMLDASAVARHADYSSHYNEAQCTQAAVENMGPNSSFRYGGEATWQEHESDPNMGDYLNIMPFANSSSLMNSACPEGAVLGWELGGGKMASCMQSIGVPLMSVETGTDSLKSVSVDAAALSSNSARGGAFNLQSVTASDVDVLMTSWTSSHSALVNFSAHSCDGGHGHVAGAMGSAPPPYSTLPWAGDMESMGNWGDSVGRGYSMSNAGPFVHAHGHAMMGNRDTLLWPEIK